MPGILLNRRYEELERCGVHPLLYVGGRVWSNEDMLAAGAHVARLMSAQNIGANYHIAALADDAALIIAYLAAEHLGIPFIPLDLQLSTVAVARILEHCQPCAVLGTPEWNAALSESQARLFSISFDHAPLSKPELYCWPSQSESTREILANTCDDCPNLIVFTSGTTSEAKGVALSGTSILVNHEQIVRVLGYTPEDRLLTPLPLSHIYGLCLINIAWLAGARLILSSPFRPKSMIEAVVFYRATCVDAIPRMYLDILRYANRAQEHARSAIASIRMWNCGGSLLSERIARDFADCFGLPILNSYGLTEAPWVTYSTLSHHRYRSVGRIVPGVEVTIVDELGQPLPAATSGDICVSGDPVMQGYYRDSEMTAKVLRDGVLRTGDTGYMDEDGFVYLQARHDAHVNVSGLKVVLSEIEEVIAAHPDVVDVAVVARPHATHGYDLVAFVVPQVAGMIIPQALQRFCRERLAAYQVPRHFVVTDQLAYTSVGKINRYRLEQAALDLV